MIPCQGAERYEEYTVFFEWAKNTGAAIANLEHRFFGASIPNNDSNYQTRILDVPDDSVTFADFPKTSTPGLENAKTIVFSSKLDHSCPFVLEINL